MLRSIIISSTSQNVFGETSNFSVEAAAAAELSLRLMIGPKKFSWPEDNSGSELCRIRFLSLAVPSKILPHTTSSEQWYPAKFWENVH